MSEVSEIAKVFAHLQTRDVVDDVEKSECCAGEVRDLLSVPDVRRTFCDKIILVGLAIAKEEDQGVDWLRQDGKIVVVKTPDFARLDAADTHILEHGVEEGRLRFHLDPAGPSIAVWRGESIATVGSGCV